MSNKKVEGVQGANNSMIPPNIQQNNGQWNYTADFGSELSLHRSFHYRHVLCMVSACIGGVALEGKPHTNESQ
ncbi:hypothetical protein M8J77_024100 [Diaphorina citri]|nr:hypothetical protein M8J77_024100 [Diaphorina citri]